MFGLFRKRKIAHPSTHHGYTVHTVPGPGIGNLTLDRETTDPLYGLAGAGRFTRNTYAAIIAPLNPNGPVPMAVNIAGIPLQAGQMVTTGLLNPDLTKVK